MGFMRSRALKVLLAATALLGIAGVAAAIAAYVAFFQDLPDLRRIEDYRPPVASRVFDRDGEEIGVFFEERRQLTPMSEIPQHVVEAFVAGEDSAFFEHAGVDLESIARAAWKNFMAGGTVQGGSTITQQMVKGLLLTPERTYRRKIREMILAYRIEQHFSKDEILYLYLNQIYFGHGAYGIGEAAQTYFGKNVSELDVSEGALLAGLPKAPSRYSPFANPDEAERRRRYVLGRMKEDGLIDGRVYSDSVAQPPTLSERRDYADFGDAAYFVEEVRRTLFEELGSDAVLRGGLRVETTLDGTAQAGAVRALRRGLLDLDRRAGYRGPLRRVAEEEIAAELLQVGAENGLVGDAAEMDAPVDVPDVPEDAPGIDEQVSGASLLSEGPYLGVVTEVDPKGMWARVGFAPGVEGTVRLEDVKWARKPNPNRSPYPMKSTRKIFQVGDVTWFSPLALGEDEASPEGVLVTLEQEPIVQGGVFSIEVGTDEVVAMVGGYDFQKSQFNRVTQARRQPGSAFKPLIYAAALAKDYTPASIVFDRPVVYVDEKSGFTWRPKNYKRSFYGPITLREALARSVNNATVHLFRDIGVDYVIDYMRRLGIESPLNRDLSLALGSSGVSLLELTRAYGVYPAGGRRVVPRFIRRVTDSKGEVLLENVTLGTPPEEEFGSEFVESTGEELPPELVDIAEADFIDDPDQILPPEEAFLAVTMLRAVVEDEDGTGWRLRALRRPIGGKTGTTNDQADAWFMGFSPELTTGVWVGHDATRLLGYGETGSRAAAPIWVDFMRVALEGRPVREFTVPEPIVFARIDKKTGLLADAASKSTVFQAFLTGTEPTETARAARTTSEGRRLLRMDAF